MNRQPSYSTSSPLDRRIKAGLIKNTLRMLNLHPHKRGGGGGRPGCSARPRRLSAGKTRTLTTPTPPSDGAGVFIDAEVLVDPALEQAYVPGPLALEPAC